MEVYINNCQDLIKNLITIGDNIHTKEQVMHVIGGLYHNYSSLVTIASYKKCDMSMYEMFSMMRNHEKQLEGMNLQHPLLVQVNLTKSYSQAATQP